MLYNSTGNTTRAYQLYKEAIIYADSAENIDLLAKLYTDICATSTQKDEQLLYIQKAISLQEKLMNENKLRDPHDLAMPYFNYAILMLQSNKAASAYEYAKKAQVLWYTLVNAGRSDCEYYLKECIRLCNHFKN